MCIKLVNQVKTKFSVRNILTQFHEITTLQAQTRKVSKIMHLHSRLIYKYNFMLDVKANMVYFSTTQLRFEHVS